MNSCLTLFKPIFQTTSTMQTKPEYSARWYQTRPWSLKMSTATVKRRIKQELQPWSVPTWTEPTSSPYLLSAEHQTPLFQAYQFPPRRILLKQEGMVDRDFFRVGEETREEDIEEEKEDNCQAHPKKACLKAVEHVFLPPNKTSKHSHWIRLS